MSSAAILVFLFITFTFTYVLFKLFSQPKPKNKKPPGPSPLPIIGNLHHILCALPHRKLHTLSQKYGPIMSLQLGQVPTVIISSSKAAELFLKTHDLVFASRPKIQASEIFSYGSRGLAFSAYGPYWRSVRKLCTLKLLSASKVEMFAPVRKEELGVLVESLKNAALVGEVVNVSEILENLVENIVYKMVLGRCHYEQFNVKNLIQQGMALLGAFNLADFVPWLGVFDLQGLTRTCTKISKAMDEVLEMIITEHEQNPIVDQNTNEDFVDILLSTIHEDIDHENEENRVSDRTYIKAILLDMIVAASDTSATSSQWTFSELLRHPRVMKKLQNEIQNEVGNDRMVEEKDVKKFTYLDMVIDEMLRVHPVAPLLVPRESRESITIDGYFIENKTRVMVNAYAIARDPTNWSNAEEFYPERFIDRKLNYQGQEFESIPFGSGRRGCAGMNMGLTTIKLIISQLVHCFDWELPNNVTPSNLNMEEKFGLTVTRAQPLFAQNQHYNGVREVKHYKKWFPWLIPFFVVANVVVFVVTMYVNNCPSNSVSCIARFLRRFSFQPLKENPLLGPSSLTLQKMGALDVNKVVHMHQGWRLITCMWLHGGVFHLLANMLGILFIGIRLEQEFGFVLIGLLFVISGFGGSLLSALFIQLNISVGASGALFGLLGGMLSELITNWSMYDNKFAAFFTLVIIIVINLAIGILPHVDNFAHIGGFLTGFLLGFVFLIRPQFGWVNQRYARVDYSPTRAKPKFKKYQCILWVISLIILIVGLSVGLVALLRGVDANDHCSWCHYLSCVPTSKWSCHTEAAYCLSNQLGNQLNVTCSSNGKSSTYLIPDPTSSQIQQLCTQICN